MQKQEDLLAISLEATNAEREKSPDLQAGFSSDGKRAELIVRYIGELSFLQEKYEGTRVKELLNRYAIIETDVRFVDAISLEDAIEYVEKPKILYEDLIYSKSASCITPLQQGYQNPYYLTGEGVIVAIIDSGISLRLPEFLNPDGSSRIIELWDQTTDVQLSGEEINDYMKRLQSSAGLGIIQDIGADTSRHGTSVARIACGNNGVAYHADIIIVKMGFSATQSFPRTTQLMEAIDFCIRKGMAYNRPIAINISYGNNYGDHTGTSLVETYINAAAASWKCSICIGSGNEGTTATHTFGILTDDAEEEVELAVSSYETSVNIQIWKDYVDDFEVEIVTPSGVNLGRVGKYNRLNRVVTGETIVLTYYGTPSPYSMRQEIYIDLIPAGNYVQYGIWKIRLIPVSIVVGRYDMWLPAAAALNVGTGFTNPMESMTLTIPSTAQNAISVGAYDARTATFAPFSGTGYVTTVGATVSSKPDLVAPGVDIRLDETVTVTGTSFATPFVTGSAALLMEWGIVRGNDPYLYGEKLKAYLLRGAKRTERFKSFPNEYVGWGALCVRDSLPT